MSDPIARRNFLKSGLALGALSSIDGFSQVPSEAPPAVATTPQVSGADDRQTWVEILTRVSYPVLYALSEGKLKATMPVESPHGNVEERKQFTYLEATGRLLAGIAPWIESGAATGAEGKLRQQYADLARKAIQSGTDPHSPDFFNFNQGRQPVVDASYLGLAILRAPTELWQNLDKPTQQNVIAALQSTRVILPYYNNWILFSAMIEATLAFMGVWWDPMRVDLALRTVDTWYKGDGVYGDGPHVPLGQLQQLRDSSVSVEHSGHGFEVEPYMGPVSPRDAGARATLCRDSRTLDQSRRHIPSHRPVGVLSLRRVSIAVGNLPAPQTSRRRNTGASPLRLNRRDAPHDRRSRHL
jgi:hypothetical protein